VGKLSVHFLAPVVWTYGPKTWTWLLTGVSNHLKKPF